VSRELNGGCIEFVDEFFTSSDLIHEGRLSCNHLIENDSHRPEISFVRITLSLKNFGSHVERTPEITFHQKLWIEFTSESKVGNFQLGIITFTSQKEIVRFEIAMKNTTIVKIL
jgi:hypothetical protein